MEKVERNNEIPVTFVPVDRYTADVIIGMNRETFPSYLTRSDDEDVLHEALVRRDIERFSFLLHDSTWVGYCVAFMVECEADLFDDNLVLYVAELAVLPDAQGVHYGLAIAQELLQRADAAGVKKIELYAREKTTYQALKESSHSQSVLSGYGYELRDHGVARELLNQEGALLERMYLMSLEKITE